MSLPPGTKPTPEVLMRSPGVPGSDDSITLVSPVTIFTPASSAAAAMEAAALSRSPRSSPSSRIYAAVIYAGFAPDVNRSFTVPQTASLPMSPPGKKIGRTTYESVVYASFSAPGRTAASVRPSRYGLEKCFWNIPSMSREVDVPPEPWDLSIFSILSVPPSGRTAGQNQAALCDRKTYLIRLDHPSESAGYLQVQHI